MKTQTDKQPNKETNQQRKTNKHAIASGHQAKVVCAIRSRKMRRSPSDGTLDVSFALQRKCSRLEPRISAASQVIRSLRLASSGRQIRC